MVQEELAEFQYQLIALLTAHKVKRFLLYQKKGWPGLNKHNWHGHCLVLNTTIFSQDWIDNLNISFAIMTSRLQSGPCPLLPIQEIPRGGVSRLKTQEIPRGGVSRLKSKMFAFTWSRFLEFVIKWLDIKCTADGCYRLTLLSHQTDEKLLFARILKCKWKSHLSLVVLNHQNKKAKQAKHVFFSNTASHDSKTKLKDP